MEKVAATKDKIVDAESEYAKLREQNAETVRNNKVAKQELNVLHSALK